MTEAQKPDLTEGTVLRKVGSNVEIEGRRCAKLIPILELASLQDHVLMSAVTSRIFRFNDKQSIAIHYMRKHRLTTLSQYSRPSLHCPRISFTEPRTILMTN